ncbi:MAG: hypothetical protein AAF519_13995 [Bacteroidota bacterium]
MSKDETSSLTYKSLFLIDSIGAICTALLLSQVLARFQNHFGAPPSVLYVLAAIAGSFAGYSFIGYLVSKDHNWKTLMRIISVANSLYCLATVIVLINLFAMLTWLGVAYFTGEIVIMLILVRQERRLIQKAK